MYGVAVFDLRFASCPPEGVAVAESDMPVGYFSNTLYNAYSALGQRSCPWVIRGQPGQRVQITLLLLHSADVTATSAKQCTKVIVAEDDVTNEYNVCTKRSRERELYTSNSHQVRIWTDTNGELDRRFILTYKCMHLFFVS